MLVQKWRKVHTHHFRYRYAGTKPNFLYFHFIKSVPKFGAAKKAPSIQKLPCLFFLCSRCVYISCFYSRSFYLYFFSFTLPDCNQFPREHAVKREPRVRKSTCASTSQHCMSDWRSLYGSSDSGWVGGEGAEEEGVMVSERRKFNNMYKIWGGQEEQEWKWEGERDGEIEMDEK